MNVMNTLNAIGLDLEKSKEMSVKLNELLASYQVFYMNLRSFHWNIRGANFFELHAKFEEFYTDAIEKVDEVAERILTLGEVPVHTYSDYLELSTIKEEKDVSQGKVAVKSVLKGFQALLYLEREILEMAGDTNDEGTTALMSDYISEQEKHVWMLSAYLDE